MAEQTETKKSKPKGNDLVFIIFLILILLVLGT